MSTYTYTSSFAVAGVGVNGATVNAYKASRFGGAPALNASPPGGGADATTTTTAAAGFNGAFAVALPTSEDYYISVMNAGTIYWQGPVSQVFADGTSTLTGPLIIRQFPFAYNTSGILTGAALYTPPAGDVIYDMWVVVTTPWTGITPQLDWGTWPIAGANGLLAWFGAAPIKMWAADFDFAFLSHAGLTGLNAPNSWSAALATAATTNATAVGKQQLKIDAADSIKVVVSQDGTNQTAVAATLTAATGPTVTTTYSTGSNNQFVWAGTDPTAGGGGAAPETFTIANGTVCTTVAQTITAMGAATGSVSGEAFSTKCSLANSSGAIELTMLTAGGGGNGNEIQAGTHDATTALGFTGTNIFTGGLGGNPGASQGAATLYLITGTPL